MIEGIGVAGNDGGRKIVYEREPELVLLSTYLMSARSHTQIEQSQLADTCIASHIN